MCRRLVAIAITLVTLALPAGAQALNREYYEPVWTKPVAALTNTWWWQVGNDYPGKTNTQVAFCVRWRQGPGPNTSGVAETGWKYPDNTAWAGNPTNGQLPAKGCYQPTSASQTLRLQLSSLTAGLPYSYCNQEWLVTAGTWGRSAIPEKCMTSRIDNVAPTTTVTIDNGAQWTNSMTLGVRLTFADTVGQYWPANFVCGQVGSQCTPTAEVTACNSYPAAPDVSCSQTFSTQPDGTTIYECAKVADSAIPDQTPQTNPDGPNYPTTTYPPNPGNAAHNVSPLACSSVRIDRTQPTFAGNTPTTAIVGQATQFSVADASSGVAGSPTWTIDGATHAGATVSHTFTTTGTKSISVPVTDNAGNSVTLTRTITVANAPAPGVGLNPESMSFSTKQNGTGGTQTLTVTNTGNANLTFTSAAFGPGSNARFERPAGDLGTCTNTTTLAAGTSCTVRLRFIPQGGDVTGTTYTGSFRIASNAAGSPHTVALDGVVTSNLDTPPAFSPTTIAFGSQPIGSTVTRTFTFTNAGDQFMPLDLTAIALTGSGQFSRPAGAAGGTCSAPSTLTGGQSCTVIVQYAPTTQDAQSGTLTLTHNYNGGGTTVVPITGTGGAPGSTATPPGSEGGETSADGGSESISGGGSQGGGGADQPVAGPSAASFANLSGGALMAPMSDTLLLKTTGGGKVMQAAAGALRLTAASRFVLKKAATALPIGLRASAKGAVALVLRKGHKTIAKGSVTLLRAGRYTFALALPQGVRAGRYTLAATFTPGAGRAVTKTLRIRFVQR